MRTVRPVAAVAAALLLAAADATPRQLMRAGASSAGAPCSSAQEAALTRAASDCMNTQMTMEHVVTQLGCCVSRGVDARTTIARNCHWDDVDGSRGSQAEGPMWAYPACSGSPAASTMDCSNLATVFDQVNTRCCNGGRGSGGSGTHRLLQQGSCVLDTCTPACADVFVSMMTDCASDLPTTGGAFSIISQIQGADSFLATCQNVLNPPAQPARGNGDRDTSGHVKTWQRVGGKFMTGDPGMLNSHHFDGSVSSGTGALGWGYWDYDPGHTGVPFSGITELERTGVARSGWRFDPDEWWVEEHGLIMDPPVPLLEGRYQLSWLNKRPGSSCTSYSDCSTPTVVLTVTGDYWSLDSGATIYDVTHLPCRSAKYTTPPGGGECLPENVNQRQFPVTPGAVMPGVPGCNKLDYAVFFVAGLWV